MNFKEYAEKALVTNQKTDSWIYDKSFMYLQLALTGEIGELLEELKKVGYHGHKLNKDRIVEEVGDVLWAIAYFYNLTGDEKFEDTVFKNSDINSEVNMFYYYKGNYEHLVNNTCYLSRGIEKNPGVIHKIPCFIQTTKEELEYVKNTKLSDDEKCKMLSRFLCNYLANTTRIISLILEKYIYHDYSIENLIKEIYKIPAKIYYSNLQDSILQHEYKEFDDYNIDDSYKSTIGIYACFFNILFVLRTIMKTLCDEDIEYAMIKNIEKLEKRYHGHFTTEKSEERVDTK